MLKTHQIAPDFTLPVFGNGESHYYGAQDKLSVLVFYKFSCPTCQLALPFLQKIYDAYGDVQYFVAIAQDGPEPTEQFRREYRITMPTLMDLSPYPVSKKYKLVSVPSLFLVGIDHKIIYSGDGFVKQDLLNLADVLAEKTGRPQIDVFEAIPVPEMKPG
jgi:peroxiredoxin